ncbi:hypothetical protein BH23PAT2_BH23PAT2_02500 [soil metagenome]
MRELLNYERTDGYALLFKAYVAATELDPITGETYFVTDINPLEDWQRARNNMMHPNGYMVPVERFVKISQKMQREAASMRLEADSLIRLGELSSRHFGIRVEDTEG